MDNNKENKILGKLIDWLWDYEDGDETSFNAAGYNDIDTIEEALDAVESAVNFDDDEFREVLEKLEIFDEVKELIDVA